MSNVISQSIRQVWATDSQENYEAGLVRAAQRGDPEAFGRLYSLYVTRLYSFLFARLDDRQDVEDLTEEVFIKAWQALPNYHERGAPFGAFLFRIARNVCTDRYRGQRPPETSLPEEWIDYVQSDPIEDLEQNQQQHEVTQALQMLRSDYQIVLSLRFMAGLSPEETGMVMGKSAGAVRVLQHRALTALRSLLDKPEQDKP